MSTSTRQVPLEFSLTTAPNGAFSFESPASPKLVNSGTIGDSQVRVYKIKNNVATVTENNVTRSLTTKEKEKVEVMVRNLISGVDMALMECYIKTSQGSPLEKLEGKLSLWDSVLSADKALDSAKEK